MGGGRRRARALLTPALACLGVVLAAGCEDSPPPIERLEEPLITSPFTLDDPAITESSGLAVSPTHSGVLYTHNDRGNAPELYAVDADGATLAVLGITGAPEGDWEDLESTPDGRLWIGDIGDNDLDRASVNVLVVQEPESLTSQDLTAEVYALVYPDGPHNAEALMVDDTAVYVVTKERDGGGIYSVPREELSTEESAELRRVADAPRFVTAASFASDGEHFALRNGSRAFLYESLDDPEPEEVRLPRAPQGESMVYLRVRGVLLVGTEGVGSRVDVVDLPGQPEQ